MAGVLVCTLAHTTLAAVGAIALRRLERVFANPLRTSVMITSAFAGIALVAPAGGLALQWVGCAGLAGVRVARAGPCPA